MNCQRIEQDLVAYLDGRADPARRRQVDEHLLACPACRERALEFRALWSVLDEVPAISPSPAFDAAVRQRVAAEPRRASRWAWLVPSPRLGFALTAVLVLAVWLSSVRAPRQPPVAAAPQSSETEFAMIRELPVLEDYDVLQGFDALSELPVQQAVPQPHAQRQP
jgi:anti-sigma factor RsiW